MKNNPAVAGLRVIDCLTGQRSYSFVAHNHCKCMKKFICLALLAGLFLFANSCHDEVAKEANSQLKSADLKTKEIVDGAKLWFENNPVANTFELLKYADGIKWPNAKVMDIGNSVVIEVPIKLKEKYAVTASENSKLNIDYRLLLIQKNGIMTSYIEFFFSKKDLAFLRDIEKTNFSKKNENFDGTIVLEDAAKKYEIIYRSESTNDCNVVKLKSAETICIIIWEIFDDGSSRLIATTCFGGGGSGGSGDSGDSNPITTVPCDCQSFCPICGKCLTLLKNAPVDGEGGTTGTAVCVMCMGHQVPTIELTSSFENNPKVMCVYSNLIRTASSTYNPLVTSFLANFSDGVSFNPGDATFTVGDVVDVNGQPLDAYGSCSGNSNDECLITIDKDHINNRSSIEIAKTMMHEILHAKIFHSKLTTSGAFENMFSQYISYTEGKQYVDQHQLMLDNYVEPMVRFLKDYDSKNGYSAPEEYYRAIALNGLPNLTSSEKTQISNAEIYFRNRGLNCQ